MLYLNSILLPKVKCGAEFSEGKYLPKRFALANNEQRNDDITGTLLYLHQVGMVNISFGVVLDGEENNYQMLF